MQPWSGVFNATRLGNRCPQLTVELGNNETDFIYDYSKASFTEDCLYLTVETPQPVAGANLPVLIFWHGGAFMGGSGFIYDGRKFLDYDIVLVVPHYRLGPIGFMCLDTDDIAGNIGMIDQVAALQWVKDHISVFGGDPNRITIMGQSAGGATTAIWAIDRANIYAAVEIGKQLGCPDLSIPGLTTCFQYAEIRSLLEAHARFQAVEIAAGRNPFAGTSPVIQKAGSVRFLVEDPRTTLENGNYTPHPALLGATKHDGTLVFYMLHDDYFLLNNLTTNEIYLQRNYSNTLINFFRVTDQGEAIAAIEERAHFGPPNMGNYTAMTPGMVDFYNNMFLKGPIDLLMLFDIPALILTLRDRAMCKPMVQLWTNFVIYGDPVTPLNPVAEVASWPMFDGSTRAGSYLRIDENWTVWTDYTRNEYFVSADEGFPWLTDH
ncbi:hypothetical protein B566_EDAN003021 [Ephemera danica]|nr:hypothetical protein B566_EDAN003021 [Ephemera danica]